MEEERKRILKRPKRSWVWSNFEEDHTKTVGKERWVTCQIENCKSPSLLCKNGNTTTMAHHLRVLHTIDNDEPISKKIAIGVELNSWTEFSTEYQNKIDSKLYAIRLLCYN